MPSVFDRYKRHLIDPLRFLRLFVEDITKPVTRERNKDGKLTEQIEYIPSQIVTEYFRHVFKTNTNEAVNGIIYQSTKNMEGKCCVLFLTKTECTDDQNAGDKWMLLSNIETKRQSIVSLWRILVNYSKKLLSRVNITLL